MYSNTLKLSLVLLFVGIALFALTGQGSAMAFAGSMGNTNFASGVDAALLVTATNTLTPTATSVAAAPAVTPTATTAVTPTATTTTAATPTKTATSVPATATSSPTVKATATLTPAVNATATVTPTAKSTSTVTPTAITTATITPTVKATATVTPTVKATATVTPTKVAAPVKAPSARAAAVNPLSTWFVVQNADPAVTANITATFYYTNGTTVSPSFTRTISPFLSTIIDQRNGDGLGGASSWQGSVVLSSDTQLAAVVNETSQSASQGIAFRADTYAGAASGDAASTILFPQLLKNMYDPIQNVNYNSTIAIQNTSTTVATHVSITYTRAYPDPAGVQFFHPNITIPAGSSVYIALDNPVDEPNLPNSGLNDFYGTGLITTNSPSDPPIVAITNNGGGGSLIAYGGFGATFGSKTLYLPQLVKAKCDPSQGLCYGTGFMVMKANPLDTSVVTVTVSYSDFFTQQTFQETHSFTSSLTLDQRYSVVVGASFYGSAVITSNQNVIAIVNLVSDYNPAVGIRSLASRAYPDTAGTSTIFMPQLFKKYYDAGTGVTWFTGFAGRLMSTTACDLAVTYYYLDGLGVSHQVISSYPKHLTSTDPMYSINQPDENLPNNTLVSGVATCADSSRNLQPIAANVNTVGFLGTLGDAAATYSGINK